MWRVNPSAGFDPAAQVVGMSTLIPSRIPVVAISTIWTHRAMGASFGVTRASPATIMFQRHQRQVHRFFNRPRSDWYLRTDRVPLSPLDAPEDLPKQMPCQWLPDRKSTRLNSSHVKISYA